MFHIWKREKFLIYTFILILLTVTLGSPELQIKAKSTATTQYNMKVHFIDVGQADCILIESNKKYMLIIYELQPKENWMKTCSYTYRSGYFVSINNTGYRGVLPKNIDSKRHI